MKKTIQNLNPHPLANWQFNTTIGCTVDEKKKMATVCKCRELGFCRRQDTAKVKALVTHILHLRLNRAYLRQSGYLRRVLCA